ncbi:MAG: LD-carboxypeptidase [Brumimicrobium sp.]|nr:LD-carboxypeptidase [Brumimicrobium sp.]
MKKPRFLKKGDTVAILAPAKAIEEAHIERAKTLWQNAGFKVLVSENCLGSHHYFSGTDAERTTDFQRAIDDEKVRAIICARGGYGCIRILDRINWASFLEDPKWVLGFSDITIFHQKLAKLGVCSVHSTMPLNYKENSSEAIETMFDVTQGKKVTFQWESSPFVKKGRTEGALIGGNLSVLCGLIGTKDMPDYTDRILFLEEVGEHLYAVDRMFYQLEKSGILDGIRGLIVGGFTNMKDTEVPFGSCLEEIINKHFQYRNIPVAFGFPAGHIDDNRALLLGSQALLEVGKDNCSLNFI